MRSDAHEPRLATPRTSTRPRRAAGADAVGAPVEALDEAFAKADRGDWRRHEPHAEEEDLSVEVRAQLAALAEQSRELTRLLGRLEASRRG